MAALLVPLYSATMKDKLAVVACISMALAVGCGAFGAHALRDTLTEKDLAIWHTAVLYQMVHSLAALIATTFEREGKQTTRLATLFLLSTTVFSGSLYLLVLLNQRWMGAITPLGGTGFIISWLLFARLFMRTNRV
jgi:uncharacterized membrane protein YgdD (TMEM256/DUF423 family)